MCDHLSSQLLRTKRHLAMIMRLLPEDSGRAGTLPLLCLAPRWVYLALQITLQPVGSYPTLSPLPSELGGLLSAALSVC